MSEWKNTLKPWINRLYHSNKWPWRWKSEISECLSKFTCILVYGLHLHSWQSQRKHWHAVFQLWKGLTSRSQSLYCCCQTGNHQMECITWGLNKVQMYLLGQGQTSHWAKSTWAINQSRDRFSSPLMLQLQCIFADKCVDMWPVPVACLGVNNYQELLIYNNEGPSMAFLMWHHPLNNGLI